MRSLTIGLCMMAPRHHRDWGLPGSTRGSPCQGRIWQPGPIWPPSQELGYWERLGQLQPRTLGPSLGNGMDQGWDGLLLHGWTIRTRPRDGREGRHCPGMGMVLLPASWPAILCCAVSTWLAANCRYRGSGFSPFQVNTRYGSELARPVLRYVLSKFSAGCGPGSNFPAIFPAAHWSALNVAFILL